MGVAETMDHTILTGTKANSTHGPWNMDPEACGLARPTVFHPSVMRVDIGTGGRIQQPEYPGSRGQFTTPTRTQQSQNKTRTPTAQGFCPWRVMELMGVPCHNGTTMYCKRPECTMNHAIATATEVTTKVTSADVANYPAVKGMKETLRVAIRKVASTWT